MAAGSKTFTTPRRDCSEGADQAAVHERNRALVARAIRRPLADVVLVGVTDHPDGASVNLEYGWS
ncbi:hypothetical protein E4P40_13210 [Blastococcus sp. CT_GayMR20]|uniref:hypothetical protein n=1 Tax=Blastococcus sp. CT_GayMR20 TaxID=2559609 RepID=UPI001072ED63|nr:hypothetical protein [Blastococcus sp. CT_GayMR20]TFV86201.1 hypothetical protein E4P40_13065 [Blastococcus sp. CT_GayMR20]TFV86226.1 hypothetical protein E4P40_13210 [Blastococcus sp. CT_GayMR20]